MSDHGERLSADDLAEALDTTVEAVREAVRAGAGYTSRSLDARVGDGPSRLELEGELETGYEAVEDHSVVEEALEALDPRRRHIVEQRFYDGMLQREVAAGIGVSQMQVSRLLQESLETMRHELDDHGGDFDIP